jgi:hypothetical protein
LATARSADGVFAESVPSDVNDGRLVARRPFGTTVKEVATWLS